MSNQKYNARFVQKIDTEVNWSKASNFYPLRGELIIYAPDENYDYPRFKVGIWDGVSDKTDDMKVMNLPFATSEQVVESGEGINSVISTNASNIAVSESSIAMGKNAQAGAKGYRIKAVDFEHKHIYLTTNTIDAVLTYPSEDYSDYDTFVAAAIDNNDYQLDLSIFHEPQDIIAIVYGKRGNSNTPEKYHYKLKTSGDWFTGDLNYIVITSDLEFSSIEIPKDENGNIDANAARWYNTVYIPFNPNIENGIEIMTGATALGLNVIAAGEGAFAEGAYTVAAGAYAHAEGRNTYAGYGAHAEGANTIAPGIGAHAEGTGSKATGNYSHAEGYETEAAYIAHAEGNKTKALGTSAHAEGSETAALEVSAHAEGTGTTASGKHSHAEGEATTASGSRSHAEGQATQAKAQASHSEGYNTTASGVAAHAEGHTTTASNEGTHAEGRETKATGAQAHAEGHTTEASGNQSHAEGAYTKALNSYSHAGGYYTKTSAAAQTAIGKYNADDGQALFIVGNGNSDTDRENAFVVKADGTAYTGSKKVLVEGEPITVDTINVQNLIINGKTLDEIIQEQVQAYIDQAILGGEW